MECRPCSLCLPLRVAVVNDRNCEVELIGYLVRDVRGQRAVHIVASNDAALDDAFHLESACPLRSTNDNGNYTSAVHTAPTNRSLTTSAASSKRLPVTDDFYIASCLVYAYVDRCELVVSKRRSSSSSPHAVPSWPHLDISSPRCVRWSDNWLLLLQLLLLLLLLQGKFTEVAKTAFWRFTDTHAWRVLVVHPSFFGTHPSLVPSRRRGSAHVPIGTR